MNSDYEVILKDHTPIWGDEFISINARSLLKVKVYAADTSDELFAK